MILLAKGTYYPNDPERHNFIKHKYAKFVMPLEEAEWIGLDLNEACRSDMFIDLQFKIENGYLYISIYRFFDVYSRENLEHSHPFCLCFFMVYWEI